MTPPNDRFTAWGHRPSDPTGRLRLLAQEMVGGGLRRRIAGARRRVPGPATPHRLHTETSVDNIDAPGKETAPRSVAVAVTAALLFAGALACWTLAAPRSQLEVARAGWALAGLDGTRVVVPAVILTLLGWWRVIGLGRRLTWSRLWPFLPLLILPAFSVVFWKGCTLTGWTTAGIAVVTCLTLGFGEEALFRGVVLRALTGYGPLPAVLGSAVLFGAFHLVNLILGNRPVDVAFQIVDTTLIGIGFAAAVLATGTIWPVMAIHAAMDLVYAAEASVPVVFARPATGIDLVGQSVGIALNALVAVYGLWLLRRVRTAEGPRGQWGHW